MFKLKFLLTKSVKKNSPRQTFFELKYEIDHYTNTLRCDRFYMYLLLIHLIIIYHKNYKLYNKYYLLYIL